jgi:hypothetical protein
MTFFVPLSLVYFYVCKSLEAGKASWDSIRELSFMSGNVQWSLILVAVVMLIAWRVDRISRLVLPLFFICVNLALAQIFFQSFNKIVLILFFAYLVISYNFVLLWRLELKHAAYNKGFLSDQISPKSALQISLVLTEDRGSANGTLTNWDRDGMFVVVPSDTETPSGEVTVVISFDGSEFRCQGHVHTRTEDGLGLKIQEVTRENSGKLGWKHLFSILEDRGLKPGLAI